MHQATLWVGNVPEAALKGLSNQGSAEISSLFHGRDVVAVTVRRKEDVGVKRKSWALVTFGSAQTAATVLEEATPQRDAKALWKMGAAGASMMRRPSIAHAAATEMGAANEKAKSQKKSRVSSQAM